MIYRNSFTSHFETWWAFNYARTKMFVDRIRILQLMKLMEFLFLLISWTNVVDEYHDQAIVTSKHGLHMSLLIITVSLTCSTCFRGQVETEEIEEIEDNEDNIPRCPPFPRYPRFRIQDKLL